MKRGEVILWGIKKQSEHTEIGDTANLITTYKIELASRQKKKRSGFGLNLRNRGMPNQFIRLKIYIYITFH